MRITDEFKQIANQGKEEMSWQEIFIQVLIRTGRIGKDRLPSRNQAKNHSVAIVEGSGNEDIIKKLIDEVEKEFGQEGILLFNVGESPEEHNTVIIHIWGL